MIPSLVLLLTVANCIDTATNACEPVTTAGEQLLVQIKQSYTEQGCSAPQETQNELPTCMVTVLLDNQVYTLPPIDPRLVELFQAQWIKNGIPQKFCSGTPVTIADFMRDIDPRAAFPLFKVAKNWWAGFCPTASRWFLDPGFAPAFNQMVIECIAQPATLSSRVQSDQLISRSASRDLSEQNVSNISDHRDSNGQ